MGDELLCSYGSCEAAYSVRVSRLRSKLREVRLVQENQLHGPIHRPSSNEAKVRALARKHPSNAGMAGEVIWHVLQRVCERRKGALA